ncbi:hypothetical protein KC19_VG100900 [Ceratodon purpureus]|nr:hypothetical protein KC19_VG100900 [Ceratodon purpureus]
MDGVWSSSPSHVEHETHYFGGTILLGGAKWTRVSRCAYQYTSWFLGSSWWLWRPYIFNPSGSEWKKIHELTLPQRKFGVEGKKRWEAWWQAM